MSISSGKAKFLVCSPNWLGDSLMAMHAVQALLRHDPSMHVTILARDNLIPLWNLYPGIAALIPLRKNFRGALETARAVIADGFDRACILPHSLRAAIICFLARIPDRAGIEGYRRGWLLTRQVARNTGPKRVHQTFEYLDVLGLADIDRIDPLHLDLPEQAMAFSARTLSSIVGAQSDSTTTLVALMPGAARGKAKQWPPDHFAELGRRLVKEAGCRILVLGASSEAPLCSQVAESIGRLAKNHAGKTSIPELAALLSRCNGVVTNDSGGMHLAAAVGTRVAAVFGTTDPSKTGPLGSGHVILQEEGTVRDRSVKRNSRQARDALRRIGPERVYRAVLALLDTH